MCKRTIFFTYILYMNFFFIYAYYNIICPSDQLWNLRARSKCQSVENYTCLIDSVKHIYKESCMGPRTEPPGDKTVVNSGNFDTKPCPPDRFQPFSFSSTQGNNCIFIKTICSDEGQIVYNNGTTRNDRECRCDYTKSFSFLSSSRKKRCSCDPTTEDCSCFIKQCGHGKMLSQDYECIKNEDFYGMFVCEEIDTRKNRPPEGTLRYLKGSGNSERITIKTEARFAALILIILTGIFITVLLVWSRMPWIPDKIVKMFNIDNGMNDNTVAEINSPLTSEENPNSSINVNKDSTSESSVDGFSPVKKTEAENLEVNTSTVSDAFRTSDTRMKRQLDENYIDGNEMETATSKSQDMEFSQSAMLPKKSQNPVCSADTKRLPLKTKEYLHNENISEKSHINVATDYINDKLTIDQKLREANDGSLTVQEPDEDSCHANRRNDESLEPEGAKCRNEISEEVLESYKNDAYISTVLKDLIDRGILSSYSSKERTPYHISEKTEKAEHEIVRIAIQKNRYNYTIQRTTLEKPQTQLLQEMSNVFTDTVKMALEKTGMTVKGLLSIIGRNNTHDG